MYKNNFLFFYLAYLFTKLSNVQNLNYIFIAIENIKYIDINVFEKKLNM
jgi:hypothetical protein